MPGYDWHVPCTTSSVMVAGRTQLRHSIDIEAPREEVVQRWTRYEDLPNLMQSVRRVRCVGDRHVLWDVDISGRQVVWEARIVESLPEKLVRWESCWGASHSGEVRFEALSEDRTRLSVEIELHPQGILQRLGVSLGLVASHVQRDLAFFGRVVERQSAA